MTSAIFSLLKKFKCRGPHAQPTKYFVLVTITLFFLLNLLLNVVLSMFIEGLTFVDSLYMMVITLTTIGYGDIVPDYTSSVWHFAYFAYIVGTPCALLVGIISEVVEIIENKTSVS